MAAEGEDPDGTARAVVAGVGDELHVLGGEGAAPDMDVVVLLDDRLARVAEIAARRRRAGGGPHAIVAAGTIAQQESAPATPQILGVHAGDSVADERQADAIIRAPPAGAAHIAADLEGVVDLGVSEALV